MDFTCRFVWRERIGVSGNHFQEPSQRMPGNSIKNFGHLTWLQDPEAAA